MVDILKISSPVTVKNKVESIPSKLPTDAVFDILNPNQPKVDPLPGINEANDESGKQSLLKNLNKEIFEPLLHSTKAQADGLRKLVLMAKLFEAQKGALSEGFLDRFFIKPDELLDELMTKEKGASIFAGEFFDSLRMLANLGGQPKLKGAIVSILKYFDCYVNQENSLNATLKQAKDLSGKLPKAEAQAMEKLLETLDTMAKLAMKTRKSAVSSLIFTGGMEATEPKTALKDLDNIIRQDKASQAEIKAFLKNEIIPELGKIAKRYLGNERRYNQVMATVHSIVRYDKSDPRLLEEAVFQLGDELKMMTSLTDEDILEMKRLVFEQALREQEAGDKGAGGRRAIDRFGTEPESDMAALLSRALDKTGSGKVNNIAQNLLQNLVQSESPMVPLMHFTIPFRYQDENTYGEFFVDKDCKERSGDAKSAKNIFFTIQSDKYGNFEVDLLVRDKRIDLDIRCPEIFVDTIRDVKSKWRDITEEQGYRLANYQVGVYQDSQTIVQRFPKLALRKVGIDVKV